MKTSSIADLSERLMRHPYFQESPGKDMLRTDISRILKSYTERPGAYKVERSELKRAIDIMLRNVEWYPDPISILRDFQRTFSFGSCTLSDPSYREQKQEERRKANKEYTPAERFTNISRFWEKKYDMESAYRHMIEDSQRAYPERWVYQDAYSEFIYLDGHRIIINSEEGQPR